MAERACGSDPRSQPAAAGMDRRRWAAGFISCCGFTSCIRRYCCTPRNGICRRHGARTFERWSVQAWVVDAIQCRRRPRTGWTQPQPAATIGAMAADFHINKLSDEFGQYTLVMKCSECGHERKAEPLTLGRLCGWDARLEDVAKRMRCSKCGKKRCTLRAFPPKKPRGYTALPR